MAKTMTVTALKGYALSNAYAGYSGWTEIVHNMLRGALDKSTNGSVTTYEDLWSDTKIDVTVSGGGVQKISLSGWTNIDGQQTFAEVLTVDFSGGLPKAKKFFKALDSFHKSSGQNGGLDTFFDKYDGVFEGKDVWNGPTFGPDIGSLFAGGSGNDIFNLNNGGSYVRGSSGKDKVNGGTGFDGVDYSQVSFGIKLGNAGGDVKVTKSGSNGRDILSDVELLIGTDFDDNLKRGISDKDSQIIAGSGNDMVGGRAGDDRLDGGDGDDFLFGNDGNDILVGGSGNDDLKGGAGNDILIAGTGFGLQFESSNDTLTGGADIDLFVLDEPSQFTFPGTTPSPVVITDFKNGTDFIGLAGFDSTTFIFDNLVFSKQGKNTMISMNTSTGTVDVALVEGVSRKKFDRSDFVEDFQNFSDYGPLNGTFDTDLFNFYGF